MLKKSCKSALEAIEYLQKENIDLMFLDIQMPDLTGIEFLQTLNKKPLVIFTTAYKEFAIEGYELDVIDYMLKPIAFERFLQGANKAMEQIKLINASIATSQKAADSFENNQKDYINLKSNHKIYKVKYSDILYIEGLKEYVTYYTKTRKIVVLESLKNLEETQAWAVPYDYDYCGMVNASYAIPDETKLGIKSVTERVYLGVCQAENEFQAIIQKFKKHKDEFYDEINNFEYLEARYKQEMIEYLNEFYRVIDSKNFYDNYLKEHCKNID